MNYTKEQADQIIKVIEAKAIDSMPKDITFKEAYLLGYFQSELSRLLRSIEVGKHYHFDKILNDITIQTTQEQKNVINLMYNSINPSK